MNRLSEESSLYLRQHADKPEHGGFYFSDAAVEVPIARSMIFQDDATPAGNAIAVGAIQKPGALTGVLRYTGYQADCYLIGQAQNSLPGILSEYRSSEPVTAWVCHGMHCMPPAESREALKQRLEDTSGSGQQDGTGQK